MNALRILHHGEFTKPSSFERWVDRALQEAGCLTYTVQEDGPNFSVDALDRMMEHAKHADVLLCHKTPGAADDHVRYMKRRYGVKVVLWTPDYRRNREWEWYESLAKVVDLTCATDGDHECRFWESQGIVNGTLRQACDPKIHYPLASTRMHDVGFLGSLYTGFRQHMYGVLRAEFGTSFRYCGAGSDVTGEAWGKDFQEVIASCKVLVGDNYVVTPGYWSDRVYLTTACGGFFLAPDDPALRAEFGDAIGYYAPKDVQDLVKQIRVALADPEREARAKAAQVLTHSQHTYAQRIARLLEMIRGLK